MRVLMQNRPNALTQRGGDTIVMERLTDGLRQRGVQVDIDLNPQAELSPYDLIHFYNFATPDLTEFLAKRAVSAGKPYVVTALYEDWPIFFNQMQLYFRALAAYFQAGQPADMWRSLSDSVKNCEPHPRLENSWAAEHAVMLLATGENEVATLRRDYGPDIKVAVNHVGCDISPFRDGGDLFEKKFGLKDFVFCCGRLETRKNQLMLLKALEDSELPLVFAAGGFTYQPDYSSMCRNFRRRGRTLFLERLSAEELTSAFCAAKVHALPSWYELPGIVSLEAARLGANVIVSDYGTSRDYFGELAFYAKPDDPEDILNAVTAAFYRPKSNLLAERAAKYTWDNSAQEVFEIYQSL